MIPKTISHYEILEPLGEGGMGAVYRAVDTRLGRPVAVKLLRDDTPANADNRKRFIQEARAASALNHPHIITIYDIGQDQGVDFIAMEYVAGESLARLIGRGGLTIGTALGYAVAIADALASAHAAGIVHRDIKPSNIVVSKNGAIKVLDFGLAKLTESPDVQSAGAHLTTATEGGRGPLDTAEGTILGTAAYMSPEQADGKRADARSDVFSFGAVLYEMVTGQRAFPGDTKMSTLAAIMAKEPEPPSRIVPGLPPDLEKVIARCLRKAPDRRWQSMADLKVALVELQEEAGADTRPASAVSSPPYRWTRRSTFLAAGTLIVSIGVLLVGVWRNAQTAPDPGRRPALTRLTSDVGWTDNPAISRDGKLLAFASDRSGDGNLDIWVQQLPDGAPVRLTDDAADDSDPTISVDGSKIAFHSRREGGGIYVVRTLGGDARLLAARGYSPRFSPDGSRIAYGIAAPSGARIDVAGVGGGPATTITPGFYIAHSPVWSPDGRFLLFWGQHDRDLPPDDNVDWYAAPVAGGAAIRTGARRALMREGFEAFHGLPTPDAWAQTGHRILFHGHVGDSWNIWQVTLAPNTWQVNAVPQGVTFGTTDEAAASVTADDRMVFISRMQSADIWSLPIEAERGRVLGPPAPVTRDAADDYDPTVSSDGHSLVFRSRRAGRYDVVLRNLRTGTDTELTQTPVEERPAISADGTKVAYSVRQDGKMPIFVLATGGGTPEQVCGDCGEVEQWSSDGRGILYVTIDDPSGVGLLNLGGSQHDGWLKHPRYGVYNPRFSSDGRWIAFNARGDRLASARLFVAQVQNGVVAPENEWIAVTEDGEAPSWSPQANLLYFWSDRDGSPCLWAQRLDPATKRPAGPPLSIHHFHSRGLSWRNLYLGAPDIAVVRDKILFNLGEHAGNIWMTNLPR